MRIFLSKTLQTISDTITVFTHVFKLLKGSKGSKKDKAVQPIVRDAYA